MATTSTLPNPSEPVVDKNGKVNRNWYRALKGIESSSSAVTTGDGVKIPVPEDYGAVGNGSTDDTTAMINFFNNSSRFGMLTKDKTYLVDGDAIAMYTGGHFWGHRASIVKNATGEGSTIRIGSDGVSLTGFCVDGGNSTATIAAGTVVDNDCILISAPVLGSSLRGVVVENMLLQNCGYAGLEGFNVSASRIVGNDVSRCGYAGIILWSPYKCVIADNVVENIYPGETPGDLLSNTYGIAVSNIGGDDGPDIISIVNNRIRNSIWEGIDEHNGTNITITGNDVDLCSVGIALEHHTSGYPAARIIVANNNIRGIGTGLTYEGITYECIGGIVGKGGPDDSSTEQGRGLIITGNQIREAGDTRASPGDGGGISIRNWRGITISNNYLTIVYRYGIILTNGSVDTIFFGTVSGNTIDGTVTSGGVAKDIYCSTRVAVQVQGNFAQGNGDGFSQAGGATYVSQIQNNYLFS